VAVLHTIYAKVISGLEAAAHERIEKALGWNPETGGRMGGEGPDSAGNGRTPPDAP
jgi:hypothetical protein